VIGEVFNMLVINADENTGERANVSITIKNYRQRS